MWVRISPRVPNNAPIAQWSEQGSHKPLVPGSSPGGRTILLLRMQDFLITNLTIPNRQRIYEYAVTVTEWGDVKSIPFVVLPQQYMECWSDRIKLIVHQNSMQPIIMKTPAGSWYKVHRDIPQRNAALNLLLNEGCDSTTIIVENDRQMSPIQVVDYPIDTFVLLNVQSMHAVVNPSVDRFMLSVSITGNHTYSQIAEYIQSDGYFSGRILP